MSSPFSDIVWVANHPDPMALASTYYVAILPARELGGRVVSFHGDMDAARFLDAEKPRVLVLTKHYEPSLLTLARVAAARGIPVVANLCDWHFDNPERAAIDRALCEISTAVLVSCQTMADAVRDAWGVAATVVEEPYGFPANPPRFAPQGALKIFWAGNETNLDTLGPAIMQLARLRGIALDLHFMSGRPPPRAVFETPKWQCPVDIRYTPYSHEGQTAGYRDCDLVIIPSLKTQYKMVKPPGRLVSAIRSGRLAVVHPLPSYVPFSAYCCCGDDIAEGIVFALQNAEACVERIRQGQAFLEERFSPAAVGRKLAGILSPLVSDDAAVKN
jgi:hypothetical protein